MDEVKVSDLLVANYKDYYKEGDSEWRRLCAIDKSKNIVSLCGDLPHKSIIEIGAGEGSILKRLSELNFGDELYALEISPSGVDAIKNKRIPRLIETCIFDGYHVPYDDNRFDVAVLSHVVEHVEHPRHLLSEASRVAKYLFIEVPLEDTVRLASDFVLDKVGHINFYSPKTIRLLVQSTGLNVIKQLVSNHSIGVYSFHKKSGVVNFYIKEALLRIVPFVATRIFTYHGALVCKKSIE